MWFSGHTVWAIKGGEDDNHPTFRQLERTTSSVSCTPACPTDVVLHLVLFVPFEENIVSCLVNLMHFLFFIFVSIDSSRIG
jgi:hypothetical protein